MVGYKPLKFMRRSNVNTIRNGEKKTRYADGDSESEKFMTCLADTRRINKIFNGTRNFTRMLFLR